MPSVVLNTCLECKKTFEAGGQAKFCSSYCRWSHNQKNSSRTREIQAEKKRIEETQRSFRILSFFEDVIL